MPPSEIPAIATYRNINGKIVYIDYLKVLLTALVILHHAFVTYGAPGGWYYTEKTGLPGAEIAMTIAVSINQSFFMGFFFFLSALFIPGSLQRKGTSVFLKDRLIRFGVPLIFYSLIQATILNFLVYRYGDGNEITLPQFLNGYDGWIDVGVLWFVLALLLFTLCYIVWTKFAGSTLPNVPLPSLKQIFFFAMLLGAASFLIRTVFEVGWTLKPVGFQLGHFPQYILVFIFGLIAAKNKWINQIDRQNYRKAGIYILCLIVIGFPAIFSLKVFLGHPLEYFVGGWHLAAFLYAFWEQITGIMIMAALLAYGKKRLNKPSTLMSKMSRCAFAVYILHPFVLVSLSLLFKNWQADPSVKLLLVAPLGVVISFLFGHLVLKIPGVGKIV